MHNGFIKKESFINTWNKGKLRNRHRTRWAKGKTGARRALYIHEAINGYRARQSLVGVSAHSANAYIP